MRSSSGLHELATDGLHGVIAEWHTCHMVAVNDLFDLPITYTLLRWLNANDAAATRNVLQKTGPAEDIANALVHELLLRPSPQKLIYSSRFNAIGCGVQGTPNDVYFMTCVFSHMWR